MALACTHCDLRRLDLLSSPVSPAPSREGIVELSYQQGAGDDGTPDGSGPIGAIRFVTTEDREFSSPCKTSPCNSKLWTRYPTIDTPVHGGQALGDPHYYTVPAEFATVNTMLAALFSS